MGISAAFRVTATPAYVVDPKTPVVINQPIGGFANSEIPDIERSLFIKASTTGQIQAAPAKSRRPPGLRTDVVASVTPDSAY